MSLPRVFFDLFGRLCVLLDTRNEASLSLSPVQVLGVIGRLDATRLPTAGAARKRDSMSRATG